MALPPLSLPRTAPPLDAVAQANPELRRVAEEFESMVLKELLGPMFEALDTEGLGGGGFGEQMFRPMLVEQYAAGISRSGGVGLADAIMRDLIAQQIEPASDQGNDNGADR